MNNKENLQKEIEALQNQFLNEFKTKVGELIKDFNKKEEQNNKPKLFCESIKENEKYYYIDLCNGLLDIDFTTNYAGSTYDKNLISQYNCYKTEEEAQKFLNHFILTSKIIQTRDLLNGDWKPDWNDGNEKKYFIFMSNDRIEYDWYYNNKKSFLYFKSEEIREQFRSLITDQEIIEYLSF